MHEHLPAQDTRALQTAAALLLAFWLVLHPVLGALAELHQSSAHAPPAGLLHAHADAQGDDPHDHPLPQGDRLDLHALLHFAHCCGHTTSAIVGSLVSLDAEHGPAFASRQLSLRAPSIDPVNPFRPPISG
jgi:hypothetical protein